MNNILTDTEARDALKRGVDTLANTVKATLGPRGRNVVIWKAHFKTVTKDGVTVANQVNLEDKYERAGAEMVKQVAFKTAELAGDGTTTATVLAQSIITAGLKNIAAGANPLDLKKGIDAAVTAVVAYLASISIKVEDDFDRIAQVGTISANGDESIGAMIAQAMKKVGSDGVIYLDTWRKTNTKVEFLEGLQVQSGWVDQQFVNNLGKMTAEYLDPMIFVFDGKITSISQVIKFLDHASTKNEDRPLILIAEDFDQETMSSVIFNMNKGAIKCCMIKTPIGDNVKDILRDIAMYTGGKFISEDEGLKLEYAELEWLGNCERIIVAKDFTTFVVGNNDQKAMEQYVADLKEQLENLPDQYSKDALKDRIAKLSAGVAVLYVGAPTDVELQEKKDRIDDALHATRAAVAEGIIPGGGVGYLRAVDALVNVKGDNEDKEIGIQIIRSCLYAPLKQICENAAQPADVIVAKVRADKGANGYNAQDNSYGDMVQMGIIDPTKVARVALENAASVAGMILTTSSIIVD